MDYSRASWSNYWVFQGCEFFDHLEEDTRLLEAQIDRMTQDERLYLNAVVTERG
jgi:hypothetical protein